MSTIVEEIIQVGRAFANWCSKNQVGREVVDYKSKGLPISEHTKELIDRANDWVRLRRAYPGLKVNPYIYPDDLHLAETQFGLTFNEVKHVSNMGLLRRDKEGTLMLRPVYFNKVKLFMLFFFSLIVFVSGICLKTLIEINGGESMVVLIGAFLIAGFAACPLGMCHRFTIDQLRADWVIKKASVPRDL